MLQLKQKTKLQKNPQTKLQINLQNNPQMKVNKHKKK